MKFFAPFRISENMSKTHEGFLLCTNVAIGRVGEMDYGAGETPIPPGPDGKVVISRTAEELFKPETMASFEGKDITILHPEDFVDPKNWSKLSKGIVQNVRKGTGAQENDLVCDFLIKDHEAIDLVENGLREVSCGYEAEYTQTGVGRGFQSGIVGNHVALVEEGRAGSSYAINDHKRKVRPMKWSEFFKSAKVAKALDEAMSDMNTETPETVNNGPVTMKDMQGYMDTQFGKLMDAFGGKKEEEKKPAEKPAADAGSPQDPATGKPAEPVAKDAEGDPDGIAAVLARIEARLSALEAGEEGEMEMGDEESEEDVEVGDESEEEVVAGKTGDSAMDDEEVAARVEILAPGLKASKGVKAKALLAAYATTDGKKAIDQFTGGKMPNVKDAATCNALFVGVSEVLKVQRTADLGGSRVRARDSHLASLNHPKGAKTPEDINAVNDKHYGKK